MTLSKRRKMVAYIAILAALVLIVLWLLNDTGSSTKYYAQEHTTGSNFELGAVAIDFETDPNIGFAYNVLDFKFPNATQWTPGSSVENFNSSAVTAGIVVENHNDTPVKLTLSMDGYIDPVTKQEKTNEGLHYTVCCFKTDGTNPMANGVLGYLNNNITSDERNIDGNITSYNDSSASSITLDAKSSYTLRYAFWVDGISDAQLQTAQSAGDYGITLEGIATKQS